ncbi:MAG: Hpt domain-containing protein [Planctomycetaceae bacterium]|nr:Hpt domain-containing protein [Planctomycetaceae bacterium]
MDSLSDQNSVLDVDELSARCLGRVELVERVLDRFQQSMGKEFAELERALEEVNVDALAGISHRIKGTSLTVSAHFLNRRAQLLEDAVKSRQVDAVAANVGALKEEWVRVHELITSLSSRELP